MAFDEEKNYWEYKPGGGRCASARYVFKTIRHNSLMEAKGLGLEQERRANGDAGSKPAK